MNLIDYERRKRSLEANLEEGIELLRAGFRAQMRALDLVWMASPENQDPIPARLDAHAAEARALALLPPPVGPEPAAPAKRTRRPAGELYNQVLAALDRMPEVFDREDLLPLLDPAPHRSSLSRIMDDLRWSGVLERVEEGQGTRPSRFRRKEGEPE
jgi:hypothetical protein